MSGTGEARHCHLVREGGQGSVRDPVEDSAVGLSLGLELHEALGRSGYEMCEK